MMLQIAKGHYISRIWFFYDPSGQGGFDVFAHLWRRLPSGPWTLEYRFRYYRDGKAHGSDDEKSWTTGTFDGVQEESEALGRVDAALTLISEYLPQGFVRDVTDIQSDDPGVIVALMSKKPYFHMKLEKVPS